MKQPTFILIFCLSPFLLFSQATELEKAEQARQEKDWTAAIIYYKEAAQKAALDSQAVFRLATAYLETDQCEQAGTYFDLAAKLNFPPGPIQYGRARCLAKAGKTKAALDALDEAANGWLILDQLRTLPEFESLRATVRFDSIYQKAEQVVYPCLRYPNYRKLDFWLGHWEVHTANGLAGENIISRATGGCVIHEDYTTNRNYLGQSLNYYDPIEKKWRQNWVGSSGDVIRFIEIDSGENRMQFLGKTMNAQGQILENRMTFTYHPDSDTVTQLIETSTDEGVSWTDGFKGIYKRKKEK